MQNCYVCNRPISTEHKTLDHGGKPVHADAWNGVCSGILTKNIEFQKTKSGDFERTEELAGELNDLCSDLERQITPGQLHKDISLAIGLKALAVDLTRRRQEKIFAGTRALLATP